MALPHRTTAPLAIATVVGVLYPAARRRALSWGATPQEAAGALAGDSLLTDADLVATRGVDVAAPPADVWPWLAQIGAGRGGFYSYDRLENLVGCDIRSADTVVDAWQHPAMGDAVHLHPDIALAVAEVEAGSHLVLLGAPDATGPADDAAAPDMPFDFTWSFVVRPVVRTGSRLLVRERYAYRTPRARALVEPVSWVSLVMTRRMLRGIRDRAEATDRAD